MQVVFLLILEHQSQNTTCFMITNLTQKHIPFSILLQILASPAKKQEK